MNAEGLVEDALRDILEAAGTAIEFVNDVSDGDPAVAKKTEFAVIRELRARHLFQLRNCVPAERRARHLF